MISYNPQMPHVGPAIVQRPLNGYLTLKTLIFGILIIQSPGLLAQDSTAQSVSVGETEIIPSVRLDYVTEDNAFRASENEVDSTGVIVSPSVAWVANRRLLNLQASYRGSYGSYSESVLDFVDHSLSLSVDANPRTRHRISGSMRLDRNHEELGTGQANLISELNDQIESTVFSLGTNYRYGARGAKGLVGGGLSFTSRTYNNLGILTEGDDNTVIRPYAMFSYRVSSDTRAVVEAQYRIVDFDEDSLDRDELSFLVGLDMVATARTSGKVRLGVTKANYDSGSDNDKDLFSADVDVTFRPLSYSQLNLSFNRGLSTVDNESGNSQDSIRDQLELSWSHQWGGRISTVARYSNDRYERVCPQEGSNIDTIGFEVSVSVRRWISVGAGASNKKRAISDCDSSQEANPLDYEVNKVRVFLKATL